jgi:hypothetical protein
MGKATASLTRESAVGDMCGGNLNHGFNFNIPANLKDGKSHSIYAYAINSGAGSNKLLTNSPKTITCQAPTLTLTPTKTPTPTVTPTPQPSAAILRFNSVKLHAIGKGGDNSNPNSTGNLNPLRTTRPITVELLDGSDNIVTTATGNIIYNSTTGVFSGDVTVNVPNQTSSYKIKVKSPQFLKRKLDGLPTVTQGSVNTMPDVSLITGDVDNDNDIDSADYNIILDCYSDTVAPKNCPASDPNKKLSADLSDDGNVNLIDYNDYIRESSVVKGD